MMLDPDDRLPSPPSKRRRTGVAGDSGTFHEQAGNPFWFSDGDFVLRVEKHLFRVHHDRLQASDIFTDMLALPQPPNADYIDGCPFVELTDAAADWLVALKWMYDLDNFVRQPVTFDMLSSALRISTKYEIAALREWCIQELRSRWPRDVETMGTNSLPHAAEAIVLARECDVPDILPAAFYALSVQKWSCCADGGRSHLVLNSSDLRRLIAGREGLQDFLIRCTIDPLGDALVCSTCRPIIERFWRTKLSPNPSLPWGCWLLRDLRQMTPEGDVSQYYSSWCADCAFQHHCVVWDRLRCLKDAIPRLFLLG